MYGLLSNDCIQYCTTRILGVTVCTMAWKSRHSRPPYWSNGAWDSLSEKFYGPGGSEGQIDSVLCNHSTTTIVVSYRCISIRYLRVCYISLRLLFYYLRTTLAYPIRTDPIRSVAIRSIILLFSCYYNFNGRLWYVQIWYHFDRVTLFNKLFRGYS